MMTIWSAIARHIRATTDKPFEIQAAQAVGGGSINQAYRIESSQHRYFVKVNSSNPLTMFEAEAAGLKAIAATQTIRVPKPICWGEVETSDRSRGYVTYLVLEWLELSRNSNRQAWTALGQNLAALHHVTGSQGYGWHQNNTIGETPQLNSWTENWTTFWAEYRIGYQLRLARRQGGHFPRQNALLEAIPTLLANHITESALVHGDLWGGNAAITAHGEPVLFDPSVYYGDREVDLAMTELFGGFPLEFYRGYQGVFPLTSGYAQRKVLYNLYHVLNHFNLFGGGYEAQANGMIDQLLKAVA